MNFRKRLATEPLTFQLAPFVDVTMFLLTFFLLTWNITRYERELDVQMPTADHAAEPKRLPGEVIVNVKADGQIILNRRSLTQDGLQEILTKVVADYPDQAVIIRADEATDYRHIVRVLDACRGADLRNILFATRPDSEEPGGGGGT